MMVLEKSSDTVTILRLRRTEIAAWCRRTGTLDIKDYRGSSKGLSFPARRCSSR